MCDIIIGFAIVLLIIASLKLISQVINKSGRGRFDSIEIFDTQPTSIGVYNLRDIEPVILQTA